MGCASLEVQLITTDADANVEMQEAGSMEISYEIVPAYADVTIDTSAEILPQVEVVPVYVSTEMAQGSIDIGFVCTVDISGETVYYLRDVNQVPVLTVDGKYIFLSSTE